MFSLLHKALLTTRRRLATAAVSAVLSLVLTLCGDGTAYVFGDEGVTMKQFEVARFLLGDKGKPLPDNYLAINIGYDRELVSVDDELGMRVGNTDITSRASLLRLLQVCDSAGGYDAVCVDVHFDARYATPADSALYGLIATMERVVVPGHGDSDIARAIPACKQARSDYATSYADQNFVKYTFRYGDGARSIATRTAELAASHNPQCQLRRCAPFWHPVRRDKMCLPLDIRLDAAYDADGEKTYYNLGADLLDCYTGAEIAQLVHGKTIVVGDFTTNDIHDTYIGPTAGPVIIINAIEALRQGRDHTSLAALAALLAVYLLISVFMTSGPNIFAPLWRARWCRRLRTRLAAAATARDAAAPRKSRAWWKWVKFVIALAGYTAALTVTQSLLYLCLGEFHDTYFATLWLSVLYLLCDQARAQIATSSAHGSRRDD